MATAKKQEQKVDKRSKAYRDAHRKIEKTGVEFKVEVGSPKSITPANGPIPLTGLIKNLQKDMIQLLSRITALETKVG